MRYTKVEKRSIKTASNNYTRKIYKTIWIVEELKSGIGKLFTLIWLNIIHTPLISTTGALKTLNTIDKK